LRLYRGDYSSLPPFKKDNVSYMVRKLLRASE